MSRKIAITIGFILGCLLLLMFPFSSAFTIGVFLNELFGLPMLGSCIFGLILTYGLIWITLLLLLIDDVEEIK